MELSQFKELLKRANLNKKQFAELLEMQYNTVNAWGSNNSIPTWVKSWLENYIKAKTYDDIKEKVFEIEKIVD
jgi:DNA-binding transcriptional regulator YiaG